MAALEKMFTFLQGKPYRLILFGGRSEVFVDDVTRYRNTGQWTDFYWAFQRAREMMKEYPPGTEFRMILVTDAILDPAPEEWEGTTRPPGWTSGATWATRRSALLRRWKSRSTSSWSETRLRTAWRGHAERAPGLVRDMIQAANGIARHALRAERGGVLRRRRPPAEEVRLPRAAARGAEGDQARGHADRRPAVGFRRHQASSRRSCCRWSFSSSCWWASSCAASRARGTSRSSSCHRGRRSTSPWTAFTSWTAPAGRARAEPGGRRAGRDRHLPLRAAGTGPDRKGVDLTDADADTRALLPMSLDELRHALAERSAHGTKDEKIFALNLDYMAKNLDPAEAERVLTTPVAERRRIPAVDFLRAKAHLLSNDALAPFASRAAGHHRDLRQGRRAQGGKPGQHRADRPLSASWCRTWPRAAARTCG